MDDNKIKLVDESRLLYTIDLLKSLINKKIDPEELAKVAKTGSYKDLLNRPFIPERTSELENDSRFITITEVDSKILRKADKSEIPTKVSQLTNDKEYIDSSAIAGKANIDDLSDVAFSGSYDDLTDIPELPDNIASKEYVSNAISEHNQDTDSHNDIRVLIPDDASEENKLVDESHMKDIINEFSGDFISSTESMVTPFQHCTIYGNLNNNLENGPWYKNGVQCTSESTVKVDVRDYANVTSDESLCYTTLRHYRYQRIKDGGATQYGQIELPNSNIVPIQVHVVSMQEYHLYFIDNSKTKYDVDVCMYIRSLTDLANSVEVYEWNGSIELTLAGQYIERSDLYYPTTRYICTQPQTADSKPIWSFTNFVNDSPMTGGQLDALNSGATSEKINQIEINKSAIEGKVDKVANATAGNLAGLDADGNITDSGYTPNLLIADWQKDGDTNINGVKNRTHWKEEHLYYEYSGTGETNLGQGITIYNPTITSFDVTKNYRIELYIEGVLVGSTGLSNSVTEQKITFNYKTAILGKIPEIVCFSMEDDTLCLFITTARAGQKYFKKAFTIKIYDGDEYHKLDDNYINETIQRVSPEINTDSVLSAYKRNHPSDEYFTLPANPGTEEYNGVFVAVNAGEIATTGVAWKGDTTLKSGYTYEFSICEGIGWIAEV